MEIINLLIIEDESAQITVYLDAIEKFNKKNTDHFVPKICRNFADGQQALLSPSYDAAIIDLKLSGSLELEGKSLMESIYRKVRIPIFIVSGSASQIDDLQENALLKKRPRTGVMADVLNEIYEIFKTGITSFLKPNGIIDQKLTEIFWKNLAKDITAWEKQNDKKGLLRYILAHFQEHLDINDDGDFEDYQPFEVYINPPIKANSHTGDLIKYRDEFYVVLTPACDITLRYKYVENRKIATRKADKLMLVKLKEFDCKAMCWNGTKVDRKQVEKYVTNNHSLRYHYLPAILGNDGFLIDFQELDTLSFEAGFERIASIAAPFIKDIISRFSNYYSRQGQPTFHQDKIVEELCGKP